MLEPEPEDDESSSDSSEEEELALRRDWRWLAATDIPFPPFSPRDLGGLPPLNFPLTSFEEERSKDVHNYQVEVDTLTCNLFSNSAFFFAASAVLSLDLPGGQTHNILSH